jgi:hypothetical protein
VLREKGGSVHKRLQRVAGALAALRGSEGLQEATMSCQETPIFHGESGNSMAPNFRTVSLSPALNHPVGS